MIEVYLDGQDITDSINAQYPLPDNPGGILPDATAGRWYDMLKIINENPTLKKNYFQGGIHKLQIIDSTGRSFEVKMLLRSKYSALNH